MSDRSSVISFNNHLQANSTTRRQPRKAATSGSEQLLTTAALQVVRLYVPVTTCMCTVVAMIACLPYYSTGNVYLPQTPFTDVDAAASTVAWQSLVNALIVIGVVVVMTFVLVLLFYFSCYKLLFVLLLCPSMLIFFLFTLTFTSVVMHTYQWTFDYITISILVLNFGVAGMIAIFWKGPLILQQFYLIFTCSMMAISFIKYLPEWTAWVLLVFISIWDLIAVLCPKGPLRMLVEISQDRNEPIFPSLIYSTTAVYLATNMEESASSNSPSEIAVMETSISDPTASGAVVTNQPTNRLHPVFEDENHGVKLGLGDFIFYSILIGRACTKRDWNTTLACIIAILVGLSFTLILLAVARKALPALPISIAFGVAFYFATNLIISPFFDTLSANQMFI